MSDPNDILIQHDIEFELLEIARQGPPGPPGPQGPMGQVEGSGTMLVQDDFTIQPTDLIAKNLTLSALPAFPWKVIFAIYGGVEQKAGVDFTVSGTTLSWNGLALELLLEEGMFVSIRYHV